MRKFATVTPTIWTSDTGREWRRLGRDHQVLGLYLVTNPHSNNYGLYYLPAVIIAEETGIDRQACAEVMQAFGTQDFARYDWRTEWVWILNMAVYQLQLTARPSPTDPRVVGLRRWYASCPANPFLGPFYDQYHALFQLEARRDGTRRPMGATQEPPPERGPLLALFERFMAHYPKQAGKRAALDVWLRLKPTPDEAFTQRCIETVERQKRSPAWLKDGGRYIPEPERWLQKGRWDDSDPELPMLSDEDAARIATYGEWAKGASHES